MRFYDIDPALVDAISAGDKLVRIKVEIVFGDQIVSIPESSIVEANFFGLKERAGGTSARGEITISNEKLGIRNEINFVGAEVRVSFSVGEGLPFFQRFRFFVDDKGFQEVLGPGRKRFVYIRLLDLSYKLRKTDEARDWTSPAVFAYSVICDKSQPAKSLVHGIAQRAGFSAFDIDCSTIPVTLPYVRLKRNIWAELSSLATAYRCHLECPVEKPLVFAHSVYQNEELESRNEECSYTFTGKDIFYFRKNAQADYYKNSVRLKTNMPVSLERQEIWKYEDAPVFYDEYLQAHYPFKYPLVRDIETHKYEAKYRIKDAEGKERNVIYADDIDTQEEAENRLDYDGGRFYYSYYDVASNHEKAILTLQKDNDGDLYKASIFGRPIVLDLNRSCFVRDSDAVTNYGTTALNVTGSYFSEYEVNGVPQYEDWVNRELAERLKARREFTLKTHKALFHARIGGKVKISIKKEQLTGVINGFSFRYKREAAFVASFKIQED